ncbi:hypothetical protein C8R43DRAFT_1115487 [Mycena crocata]|nr:hypothetical protein C8R43DRAFT_1115487 [Mycena crocata]
MPAHRIVHAPPMPMPHEHVVHTDIWLSQAGKHDMPPTRVTAVRLTGMRHRSWATRSSARRDDQQRGCQFVHQQRRANFEKFSMVTVFRSLPADGFPFLAKNANKARELPYLVHVIRAESGQLPREELCFSSVLLLPPQSRASCKRPFTFLPQDAYQTLLGGLPHSLHALQGFSTNKAAYGDISTFRHPGPVLVIFRYPDIEYDSPPADGDFMELVFHACADAEPHREPGAEEWDEHASRTGSGYRNANAHYSDGHAVHVNPRVRSETVLPPSDAERCCGHRFGWESAAVQFVRVARGELLPTASWVAAAASSLPLSFDVDEDLLTMQKQGQGQARAPPTSFRTCTPTCIRTHAEIQIPVRPACGDRAVWRGYSGAHVGMHNLMKSVQDHPMQVGAILLLTYALFCRSTPTILLSFWLYIIHLYFRPQIVLARLISPLHTIHVSQLFIQVSSSRVVFILTDILLRLGKGAAPNYVLQGILWATERVFCLLQYSVRFAANSILFDHRRLKMRVMLPIPVLRQCLYPHKSTMIADVASTQQLTSSPVKPLNSIGYSTG